ncbi:hypothetical protein CSQ90_04705 [Janthinobacterium sp. BJB303]|nr:hypothetical protein CSQ90_04705 [Janthinobacterium sp. BJB303]
MMDASPCSTCASWSPVAPVRCAASKPMPVRQSFTPAVCGRLAHIAGEVIMNKLFLAALLWLACLGCSPLAQALQMTLVPRGGYQIAPGGTVLVDLNIAGLQSAGLSTELGAFHLDLYYDPDLLFYLPGAPSGWGTALGQTAGGAQALAFADHGTPGLLHLDEVSLLDALTLGQLQGDGFRLATLAFQARMPGGPVPANTFLFADDILLGDAAGNRIPVALDEIPVLILQVEEPATIALFGMGVAALAWQRRRVIMRPRRRQAAHSA